MKSISSRENQVIHEINNREMIVFTKRDITRFLDISDPNANRILSNMVNKELIVQLERGKYILAETFEQLDVYEIAPYLFQPSYIGFWNALHIHSMTDQVPRSIFLATTKRKRDSYIKSTPLRYVLMKSKQFFGYVNIDKILVSDREKTIIDCIRYPEYSGGISHIFGSIPDDIDTNILLDYCKRTRSSSVASRLGYLLEKKEIQFEENDLISMISSYSDLDPSNKNRELITKWKLYVDGGPI